MYMVTSTVPFDMIIDTDLGLWKLVQDQYPNENFFYQGMIYERDLNFMKYIMVTRKNKNPLNSIMKPDYIKNADSLYNQFMEEKYDDILKLSVTTGIYDIICRSKGVNDVLKFTVLCKSQKEVDDIKGRFKRHDISIKTILYDDLKEIDVSSYGSVYIKDINDFFLYSNVEGKNVIVGNYGFNLEGGVQNTPLLEPAARISKLNVVQLVDMHLINENTLPVG